MNPAAAVRGPKHVVTKGATPVLSPAEARRLLEALDTAALAGLRDRALVSVMLYSFARVSAVIAMRRQDYFRQESRGWLRLHEKGGKRHDVPAHHRAAEALDDYLELAGARRSEGGALPERRPGGSEADGPGAVAASRSGDDQAARRGRGSAALDLLPHVSGDGDHGVSVERGDARVAAVESRPVVAYAGGEVVVEVGRVVDALGPQGVALQVQRPLGASDGLQGGRMETGGVRRLNRSSPSCLNRPAQ